MCLKQSCLVRQTFKCQEMVLNAKSSSESAEHKGNWTDLNPDKVQHCLVSRWQSTHLRLLSRFLSGVLGFSLKSFLVQYLNLNGRSLSTFFEAHVLYYHVMYYINKIIQYSNSRSRKHVEMLISVKYIDMHILIILIDMLTAES